MEKYTRIAIEVDAIQWFPTRDIPITGFQNVVEEYTDRNGQKKTTVNSAVIVRVIEDKEYKLELTPRDWVLIMPNGGLTIVKDEDFVNSFFKTAQLRDVKEHGTPEQKAMFGISDPDKT